MSNLTTPSSAIELALMQGDLSKLSSNEKLSYFKNVCESLGLNPLTKPFEFITLNGKLVLYARKDATDQLRKIHSVSITITDRQKIDDVYIVTAKGRDKNGREDESTGAVNVAGLKGEALANAFMKSESKAKRRVTLSLCGLGILDESEVADIPEIKEAVLKEAPKEISKSIERQDPAEFKITFGKFKGQKIGDVDAYEIASYVDFIEKNAKDNNKEIKGDVAAFMRNAMNYISSLTPDISDGGR